MYVCIFSLSLVISSVMFGLILSDMHRSCLVSPLAICNTNERTSTNARPTQRSTTHTTDERTNFGTTTNALTYCTVLYYWLAITDYYLRIGQNVWKLRSGAGGKWTIWSGGIIKSSIGLPPLAICFIISFWALDGPVCLIRTPPPFLPMVTAVLCALYVLK